MGLAPRLVACASCGCYARSAETGCPHCGAPLRSPDGTLAPTQVALLLGFAALTAPFALQSGCGGEVIGTGAGGASGSSTTAETTTVGPATTGPATTGPATTTVTTTISASATATIVSTSTDRGGCDGAGVCGDTSSGCIACAIANNCAYDYDACASDADCVAYADCAYPCVDQPCVDQCNLDHPTGAALYDTLLECVYCYECYVDCDGPAQGCP